MARKTERQFEFRVIAGELKGKRVRVPDLGVTRPPLTRLRKAIFDFLMPYLDQAAYLDLFSGTGSYLFEAVSRGVASAIGVEHESRLAEAINRQAETLNVSDRLVCLNRDVFVAIPELMVRKKKFDVVMIAPPQYQGLVGKSLRTLREGKLLRTEGLLICQHDTSETDAVDLGGFAAIQRRKYGNTTFTVLHSG